MPQIESISYSMHHEAPFGSKYFIQDYKKASIHTNEPCLELD